MGYPQVGMLPRKQNPDCTNLYTFKQRWSNQDQCQNDLVMTSVLPPIQMDGNYPKSEVARILGISRTTLDKFIKEGNIRCNRHRYTTRVTIKGREIERFFNAKY